MKNDYQEFLENAEDEFDLRTALEKYLSFWYLFVATTLLSLGCAWIYNKTATPIYGANVTVLVQDEKKTDPNSDILKDLDPFGGKKVIENETEILRSKTLMQKAIDSLDFDVTYVFEHSFKTKELYKNSPFTVTYDTITPQGYNIFYEVKFLNSNSFSFSYKYGIRYDQKHLSYHRIGDSVSTPFGKFMINKRENFESLLKEYANETGSFKFYLRTRDYLAADYRSRLSVDLVARESSVLSLSVEDEVPQKGVNLLNALANAYIKSDIDEKNRIARTTLNFINERLKLILADLSEVELGVEKFKTERGTIDIGSEATIFLDNVKNYDAELSKVKIQLNIVTDIERYINNRTRSTRVLPTTLGITDPLIIKLVNELSDLESKREQLARETKADNPRLLAYDSQIDVSKSNLLENVQNLKLGLKSKENDLKRLVSKFEKEIKGVPETQRELVNIERQQTVKQNLYIFLLQKQEETALSFAATIADSKIIDEARSTYAPVKPYKGTTYLIAFIAGLVLPILFINGRYLLNNRITDAKQIRSLSNLEVTGSISENKNKNSIVAGKKNTSPIAEEFRFLRTSLLSGNLEKPLQKILITSNGSGEGKTFIAINLGITFALSGKRTVLLEMDLRKPGFSTIFNSTETKGSGGYLIGNADLNEIIVKSEFLDSLYIIQSGPVIQNPAELFLGENLKHLMNYLETNFDYIIIDTPPVGIITDGLQLVNWADQILYIVRYNFTKKKSLNQLKQLQKQSVLSNVSIIFNKIRLPKKVYKNSYYHTSDKQTDIAIPEKV